MPHNLAPTPIMDASTLISALRRLRADGVLIAHISKAFGVTQAAAGGWLDGKRNPSRMACALAWYVFAQAGDVGAGLPCIVRDNGDQSAVNPQANGTAGPGRATPRKAKRT